MLVTTSTPIKGTMLLLELPMVWVFLFLYARGLAAFAKRAKPFIVKSPLLIAPVKYTSTARLLAGLKLKAV